MRDLPLAALRAFAAVHETGGVRPAARSLGIAHSAVSRHVRELEAWLGVALVEPRPGAGRFSLTPHGDALGRAAASGLKELGRAVDSVRELRRANSVVVAAPTSFAARWLLPRLPGLYDAHPWIEVSVVARQRSLDLADQGADMAVRMGAAAAHGDDVEPLMDEALVPVATRSYWASLRERDPVRALARARLIHDRDPASVWERWFADHPSPDVDLRAGPRFTSSDLVLQAAAQGLGVALARCRLAEEDLASGRLFRPFGDLAVPIERAYWLVLPQGGPRRSAERAVAEWIRAEAGSPIEISRPSV